MKKIAGSICLQPLITATAVLFLSFDALASEAPVIPPQELVYCTVCHGADMMGNKNIEAPRLSGMEPWYLVRQLEAFNKGWRGSHDADNPGIEMRPMAEALEVDEYAVAAEYVSKASSELPQPTIEGDATLGKLLYSSCGACHGSQAEGIEALGGPALTIQNDWYLANQLLNFRNGVRGSLDGDTYGQQMRAAALLLPDDDAVIDVVAYISTLQYQQEN